MAPGAGFTRAAKNSFICLLRFRIDSSKVRSPRDDREGFHITFTRIQIMSTSRHIADYRTPAQPMRDAAVFACCAYERRDTID